MGEYDKQIADLNAKLAMVLMESKVAEQKVSGMEETSLKMEEMAKRLPELDGITVCAERLEKLESRLQQQQPVTALQLTELKKEIENSEKIANELTDVRKEVDIANAKVTAELAETKVSIASVIDEKINPAQKEIEKFKTEIKELLKKQDEYDKSLTALQKELEEKVSSGLKESVKNELEKFKSIVEAIEKAPEKISELDHKITELSTLYEGSVASLSADLELAKDTERRINSASRLLADIEKKAERLFAPMDNAIADMESFIDPKPEKELGFELDDLLSVMIKHQASDLHLKEGAPPTVRLEGDLVPVGGETLTDVNCKYLVLSGMKREQRLKLLELKEIDFAYSIPEARFRVNAFLQKGTVSASYRMLKTEIPSIESLRLPPVLKQLVSINNGLILVTGPAGSGKSTTLASLVEHLNANKKLHIVTIEDPIEYIHTDKLSLVTQREVGSDTPSFLDALKASLRQDPNVILIGEMRDSETILTSTIAAETGHLVLSTLHTPNTVQAVQRIIDVFPGIQQAQYRTLLSTTLRAVVSQRLLNRIDAEGRVAVVELMIVTPTIAGFIAENKLSDIYPLMVEGKGEGMQTFTKALTELVEGGIISKEDALHHAEQRTEFRLEVEGHSTGSSANIQDDSLMSWL